MSRKTCTFSASDPSIYRLKLLQWLSRFTHCCLLDSNSNNNTSSYHSFDYVAAAGMLESVSANAGNGFATLKEFHTSDPDWLFGFFGYDLKNEIEKLNSSNKDLMEFPDIFFFRPETVVLIRGNQVTVETLTDPAEVMSEIESTKPFDPEPPAHRFNLHCRMSKEEYLEKIKTIQDHILQGDVYELNYCMEFYSEDAEISPFDTFRTLTDISPMPFSAIIKNAEKYLICASPERFLKKSGSRLISQPIKGTAKRGETTEEDAVLKNDLKNSLKERSENVMIVDLVRNDLARSSVTGSVKVEELFGIYTFAQLHQMISTVSSELRPDLHFTDAIRYAFPMGSMTGAPKIRAMQLIEKYELSKRGLFSGAAGYITPDGDFDLNVVIRSILYDEKKRRLSFQAGSAITFDSVPEAEFSECMLKAQAIFKVLNVSAEVAQM